MGYSKLTYEEYIEHPEVWGISIPKWANELSAKGYKGISAIDFYDDIFGDDLEEERMPDDYVTGEYGLGDVYKRQLLLLLRKFLRWIKKEICCILPKVRFSL